MVLVDIVFGQGIPLIIYEFNTKVSILECFKGFID